MYCVYQYLYLLKSTMTFPIDKALHCRTERKKKFCFNGRAIKALTPNELIGRREK